MGHHDFDQQDGLPRCVKERNVGLDQKIAPGRIGPVRFRAVTDLTVWILEEDPLDADAMRLHQPGLADSARLAEAVRGIHIYGGYPDFFDQLK